MQIIETVPVMQSFARKQRESKITIGLVATMGYLHEGHLSLVDVIRESVDIVILSIYINPSQFGPNEDFRYYPRDRQRDIELCQKRKVDVIFCPKNEDVYSEDHSVYIREENLSHTLCGIFRPKFLSGVCTIVAKLFNIVQPHTAVFGMKDFQQVAVIKKMVRDLNFPVEIILGTTVREKDGLAMSSRNAYLSKGERNDAIGIYKALCYAKKLISEETLNVYFLRREIVRLISERNHLRVIYVSILHRDTLRPLSEVILGETLIGVAVWCGNVRLVDNILI